MQFDKSLGFLLTLAALYLILVLYEIYHLHSFNDKSFPISIYSPHSTYYLNKSALKNLSNILKH